MSCDGASSFGYVKIEEDKVVCYTGDPSNPEVHKFCNDEFVQAMNLKRIIEARVKQLEKEPDELKGRSEHHELRMFKSFLKESEI